MNQSPTPPPFIAIIGPTSSGKSALAIKLAKKFGGTIISADSRQVYRGMNLGTGKITKREMAGIPHELIDVADPKRQFTVADFQRKIRQVMRRAQSPFWLVGGSPFYIDAVIYDEHLPKVKPNRALRKRLEAWPDARLVRELGRRDPARAKTIDQRNRRRLIRALEICLTTNKPQTPRQRQAPNALILGISMPRTELYRRIRTRILTRLKRGMIAEVRRLHDQGVSWKRLDAFGLEYRFISRFLQGQLTKNQMIDQLEAATHAFARRQLTWWRRNPDIRWITTAKQAEQNVRQYINKRKGGRV